MKGKSKVKSSNNNNKAYAKGGSTKMFGKQGAGPQKSGQTAHGSSGGGKWGKGGSGRMFGKQSASPAPSGRTGK